jgi:hypothetical protein
MTNEEMRALCAMAGVLPSELIEDPEHGLLISLPGIRKIAQYSPNQRRANDLVEFLEEYQAKLDAKKATMH